MLHQNKASVWFFCSNNLRIQYWYYRHIMYAALLWQKGASDIYCKRAKCACHFHWHQWIIKMSYLTYLLAGWVLIMHKIWPGRRAQRVTYENINNSDLDGMSLASFCHSRAVWYVIIWRQKETLERIKTFGSSIKKYL